MSKPRQVNKSKKPVLLIAGNLRSNKNIDLAIKAFQMLDGKTRKEWQLCIRGRSPYSERRYREVIENLIRNDGLGIDYKNCYLDEKEFDTLIDESAYMVLLYTSFESQSGIVARSINQSTPFICTRVSSFTEILGEESAIFCKPNVESVMLAFQKACQEGIHGSVLRAGNMQNIYETFSWEKSAEEHIKLYNRLK
jgi:glycosyltransferase involved in cell wall biosynthesis